MVKSSGVTAITKSWERVWKKLNLTNVSFQIFVEKSLTTAQRIKAQELLKNWSSLTSEMEVFYDTLEQTRAELKEVKAVEIKLPFEDDGFTSEWQNWKDYLLEQHGVAISSRAELKQLSRLKVLSDNNLDKAKAIIDYSISSFYKGFFAIEEKPVYTNKKTNKNLSEDDFK